MKGGLVLKKCYHGEIAISTDRHVIVADYVANHVIQDSRWFEKCKWYWLPAQNGAGKLTTKREMYPFVDAVGECSYLPG